MAGKRILVRAAAVMAVGVLIAVAGLASGPARGASALAGNSRSLPDPVGDVKGAAGPDISSVAISDDGTQGVITVTTVAPLPDYGVVVIGFDADRNPATGEGGVDEMIGAALKPDGYGSAFLRWDGSGWQSFDPVASAVDVSDNTVVIRLARSDMLGTGAFDFWVEAMMFDSDGFARSLDLAPDSGTVPYAFAGAAAAPTVTPTASPDAPQLSFGAVRVAPSPVHAGRRETITFTVQAGKGISVGKLVGAATKVTIAGKPVPHSTRAGNGTVTVTVAVPKTARGKRLVVSVDLDGIMTRTVSYVVR